MHGLVLALRAATVRIQSLSSLDLPNSFVLFRMKVFVHIAGNRVVGGGGVGVVGCVFRGLAVPWKGILSVCDKAHGL